MTVTVPHLAERREQIIPFSEYFLNSYSKKYKKPCVTLSAKAKRVFREYDWPGNIRELENVLERAVIVSTSDTLTILDLPADVRGPAETAPSGPGVIEAMERTLIEKVLAECDWNKSQAARRLGIGRRTLYSKAAKYGIRLDRGSEKE